MKKYVLVVAGGFLCMALAATSSAARQPSLHALSASGFASIVSGAVITQEFGCTTVTLEPFDPACPTQHFHSGIDLAAPYGTPVFAAAAGLCRVIDSPVGYGLHVILSHGGGLESLYGHLAQALVTNGQAVSGGQEIGLLGSSGMSTGPHVHFEILDMGLPVDPNTWLPVLQKPSQRRPAT